MSLISTIRQWFGVETRGGTPANPGDWLLSLGRAQTTAGVNVTEQSSLQSLAVLACVRVLAETVGSLPLVTYRRLERGKERAANHPLYPILHDLPNPEMTSVELRETLMGHVALWGNAYSEIEFDGAGRVVGLWPLRPDKTKPKRVNGRLIYVVEMPVGPDQGLPFDRVMHLRGLGYDGILGYNPIALARQAIGLALATEEFGARFFGNGARPGTVLEHPGKLSDDAQKRLTKSVEMAHGGLEKSHRLMVLEEGMKIETIGVPPEDAQFLETRKFQVSEIARLYRIPPHMIGDLDRATFSNIEQQSLEFVSYTLQPWLTRWEQAIYRDLLMPSERRQYFAEHLLDALLRGDTQSRYEAYNIGRQGGWLSANDIREKENMNPVEGGDVYLVPLNMVPADQVGESPAGDGAGTRRVPSPPTPLPDGEGRRPPLYQIGVETRAQNIAKGRQRLANSYERVIRDAVQRVVRREIADVRRAVEKYLKRATPAPLKGGETRDEFQFSTWLKQFYEEHRKFWQRQILPILLSYADQVGANVGDELGKEAHSSDDIRQFIDDYVTALAAREVGSSQLQLQALLDQAVSEGTDPGELLTTRLDEWEERRVDKVTRREKNLSLNAFVVAFYILSGVKRKRWVALGDSCPYCRSLDGKVVEVEKFFVAENTDFQPDGADKPLNVRFNMGHGPAHGGCDCTIVAED